MHIKFYDVNASFRMLTLTKISIYPVKSFRGNDLEEAVAEARGFRFDRRWMLIDSKNRFISQRECPRMAVLRAFPDEKGLKIVFPDGTEIAVNAPNSEAANEIVTIWDSEVPARIGDAQINTAISDFLGVECRLAYMPDETERKVDQRFGTENEVVSFADGFPYLIIGSQSLAELNRRLTEPMTMERFRPNLVFDGGEPFCEDKWRRIKIGEVIFRVVKPCARCVITTIDYTTGEIAGPEPLRTLAKFRRVGKGVNFGQNMIAETADRPVRIGDKISVLEYV